MMRKLTALELAASVSPRHELGHILGFRHEHIRSEANSSCDEGGAFRAVTDYDQASVMHYLQSLLPLIIDRNRAG